MRYLTDRKRAQGLGAGREGTHHHWQAMVSSILLVVLVPAFVVTFALGLSDDYQEVIAYFSQPLPALITGISFVVIVLHLMNEANVAVEDYVHGVAEKLTLIAVKAFSYTLIAVGLFALAKIAL
jgi:succinate dehydrogenase / fumarate reductase membrane anchor subunit